MRFDPNLLAIYAQHEALSDLVVNVTQKVYFYSFIRDPLRGNMLTDNFFNIQRAQLRYYN